MVTTPQRLRPSLKRRAPYEDDTPPPAAPPPFPTSHPEFQHHAIDVSEDEAHNPSSRLAVAAGRERELDHMRMVQRNFKRIRIERPDGSEGGEASGSNLPRSPGRPTVSFGEAQAQQMAWNQHQGLMGQPSMLMNQWNGAGGSMEPMGAVNGHGGNGRNGLVPGHWNGMGGMNGPGNEMAQSHYNTPSHHSWNGAVKGTMGMNGFPNGVDGIPDPTMLGAYQSAYTHQQPALHAPIRISTRTNSFSSSSPSLPSLASSTPTSLIDLSASPPYDHQKPEMEEQEEAAVQSRYSAFNQLLFQAHRARQVRGGVEGEG
ncbi:hypothetical protein HDV00_010344 [Rhizophlyctis rosea]|nr:hypothetical protein HDV00_010344 [Rhizophlyctis rosea]